eukprot:7826136-Pyramimonas_sp.AAC.1
MPPHPLRGGSRGGAAGRSARRVPQIGLQGVLKGPQAPLDVSPPPRAVLLPVTAGGLGGGLPGRRCPHRLRGGQAGGLDDA